MREGGGGEGRGGGGEEGEGGALYCKYQYKGCSQNEVFVTQDQDF